MSSLIEVTELDWPQQQDHDDLTAGGILSWLHLQKPCAHWHLRKPASVSTRQMLPIPAGHQALTSLTEERREEPPAWLPAMLQGSEPYQLVMDIDGLRSGANGLLHTDHMFRAFAHLGLVTGNWVLFRSQKEASTALDPSPTSTLDYSSSSEQPTDTQPFTPNLHVVNAYQLGDQVCGHHGVVHGGLTAAMLDETFGILLYLCKDQGQLDFPVVLTANLSVDYKKPVPSGSLVVCSASVQAVEGRKVWVTAQLRNRPATPTSTCSNVSSSRNNDNSSSNSSMDGEGTLYATAKALFIIPRRDAPAVPAAPSQGRETASSFTDEDAGNPSDV